MELQNVETINPKTGKLVSELQNVQQNFIAEVMVLPEHLVEIAFLLNMFFC